MEHSQQETFSQKCRALAHVRNHNQLLEVAKDWTFAEPANHHAWQWLSYAGQYLMDYRLAAKSISMAVSIHPDDPSLLYEAGVIRENLGETASAIDWFERCASVCVALKDDYYHDAARLAAGWLWYGMGSLDNAKAAIADLPPEAATWMKGGRKTLVQLQELLTEASSGKLVTAPGTRQFRKMTEEDKVKLDKMMALARMPKSQSGLAAEIPEELW